MLVNCLFLLCFVPLMLYGVYALWDSAQMNRQADQKVYETYRPGEEAEAKLSFGELQRLNPEVFGWLTVYGTNIDYPLVQAENNSKYVNTDAEGKFALSGSIFLDYRNDKAFGDINNILYGHHMEKKMMFGEVESFLDAAFFEEHPYGAVFYEGTWHGIEFFAFLHADAYDPVLYHAGIQGDDGRQKYLTYIKEHAVNFRELDQKPEDSYISLSTCASDSTNGRHILVGRITDKPEKDPFHS